MWSDLKPVGLLYTDLTKKAMEICWKAHKDQLDKSGMPYVFHPFHLMEQMETEAEICVALLHDVAEDSDMTLEDLRAAGFPDEVLEALKLLTHDDETPYLEYVRSLKDNPLARKVKLADLKHNSTLERLPVVTDKDLQRFEKYQKAIRILTEE